MAHCVNCGKALKEGVKFCTSCGTAVDGSQGQAAAPTGGNTGVVSTLGWLGTMLVLFIPIVGIVLHIIWAVGAVDTNLNRRNFCRASLILMAVSIVLGIIFSLATVSLYGSLFRMFS